MHRLLFLPNQLLFLYDGHAPSKIQHRNICFHFHYLKLALVHKIPQNLSIIFCDDIFGNIIVQNSSEHCFFLHDIQFQHFVRKCWFLFRCVVYAIFASISYEYVIMRDTDYQLCFRFRIILRHLFFSFSLIFNNHMNV